MILFIGLEQMADFNDSVLGNASKEYASTEGYLEACIGDLSQIFKLEVSGSENSVVLRLWSLVHIQKHTCMQEMRNVLFTIYTVNHSLDISSHCDTICSLYKIIGRP